MLQFFEVGDGDEGVDEKDTPASFVAPWLISTIRSQYHSYFQKLAFTAPRCIRLFLNRLTKHYPIRKTSTP